ncbi:MAG TPA: SulP family inorganic anion transporter [Steroidobacter sp.]|nr:SulP family inorganic anion transporter [Steroidobacter sp.]
MGEIMDYKRFLGSKVGWVPALRWIPAYSTRRFGLDLIAGLSLAAFVIPESLAYASLAQLPPVTGLYCYLVAGIVYALFGTSGQLAVGPTSALAIVLASSVAAMGGDDPSRAVAIGSAVALMVGMICVAGRFVGLANAAYFISNPVLIGFKTGAALYIASTQLPKLFGLEGATGNFFSRVAHVAVSLPETHVPSLLFGLVAIALFMVFERVFPGRPTTLIVVIVAIAMMTLFGLSESGIKIVGDLPSGLPGISVPTINASDISALIPVALACFVLAYGETISVARSFAQKYDYEINPEQELTALGAANIATGMAHGFPVAGGMSQTAVNDMGGATSPVALIVTSGAIALTLLFFATFFHNLPEPVLGAIVLMAASHLVRFEELRRLLIESRAEFWTSMVACVGVLFFGLLNGLLLAAVGSLVMLIAQTSRPMVVVVGRERSTGHFVSRARNPDASDTPGALVVRSASTWLYFNAEHIRRQIVDMIDGTPAEIRTVVLDFSSVPAIDITAGTILRGLVRTLKDRGIRIELAELHDEVVETLKIIDAEHDLGPVVAHRTIEDCLAAR